MARGAHGRPPRHARVPASVVAAARTVRVAVRRGVTPARTAELRGREGAAPARSRAPLERRGAEHASTPKRKVSTYAAAGAGEPAEPPIEGAVSLAGLAVLIFLPLWAAKTFLACDALMPKCVADTRGKSCAPPVGTHSRLHTEKNETRLRLVLGTLTALVLGGNSTVGLRQGRKGSPLGNVLLGWGWFRSPMAAERFVSSAQWTLGLAFLIMNLLIGM